MQAQLLPPSVQNGYHSHLYFLVLQIVVAFPSRLKQSIIHYFWLMYSQRINTSWQGKTTWKYGTGKSSVIRA
jgi:hypothetical protein